MISGPLRFCRVPQGLWHGRDTDWAPHRGDRVNRQLARAPAMPLITLRQLLDHAAEHSYGVPAFNINNMEQGLAILEAAQVTNAPVIIQTSHVARKYAGDIMLMSILDALQQMYPTIPICLHQDHANNVPTCLSAIQNGFTSVMIDGSLWEDRATPASYKYNVAITRQVSELAHMVGASVEGELGCPDGTDSKLHESMRLTDPDQARAFVVETKVDALAVAIGTSHGAYKAACKFTGNGLAVNAIDAIQRKIPNTHIVMHGSSEVPEEWQEIVAEVTGQMKETCGIPLEEIVRAIQHGVRKVNIDTDLWLIAATDKRERDPRKFLKSAMDAMRKVCTSRFEAFGTAGQAHKIAVVPLAEMAKRYAKGTLDRRIVTGKAIY